MDMKPNSESERRLRLQHQSSSALICLPFLDTDVSTDTRIADEILTERGYRPFTITLLRRLASIGLFWQMYDWEWAHLDIWDVIFGYASLAIGLGVLTIIAGWFFSPTLFEYGGATLIVGIAGMLLCKLTWIRK